MFGECLFSKILHRLQNMRNYHPRPVLAAAAGGEGIGSSSDLSDSLSTLRHISDSRASCSFVDIELISEFRVEGGE